MKAALSALLEQVVINLKKDGVLADDVSPKIVIEHTRDPSHGDFASNLAMMLAKPARQKPRDLAEKIVAALPENSDIDKVEIAGPGFINFFMNANTLTSIIPAVLDAGEVFGHSSIGNGKHVQVEFVSANPTGPLHVGHGVVLPMVQPLLTYLLLQVFRFTVSIMLMMPVGRWIFSAPVYGYVI